MKDTNEQTCLEVSKSVNVLRRARGAICGNSYQKANETEQRRAKGQSGYQDGGAIRPVALFPVQGAEIPLCRLVARDAVLAAESIQMSSAATGSTISAPAISGVQGVMRRETGNN